MNSQRRTNNYCDCLDFFLKLRSPERDVHSVMASILLDRSKLVPLSSSFREMRLTLHKSIWGKNIRKKKSPVPLKKIAMEVTTIQMSTK